MSAGCATPVILISALRDEGAAERAQTAGAHCLLGKPFDAESLICCLREALTSPAPTDPAK